MTPEEFKGELAKRGWTQQGFADHTGIPKRTIESWSGGQRSIPRLLDLYFEKLEENEKLRARIASLGGKI